ncbi:MAG: hypothetical protein ACI8RZ_004017 [Myxococcota bacterium]|jgi:hypothetical protein
MIQRLFTAWAFLGLTALTATAVGWRPASTGANEALSLAPTSFRAPPADVADVGILAEDTVSLTTFLATLEAELAGVADSPAVQADFKRLTQAHHLDPTDALLSDYIRVKLVFEATRDAGWWYLRWDITDREPRSDAIWARWAQWPGGQPIRSSAIAECDELSALFAFLARHLGVEEVGLFWPTSNHTVAVWSPQPDVRLIVPTTQIFLSDHARLGTAEMDPFIQRTIYNYTRHDVPDDFEIPGDLAAFFQLQVRRYITASEETLQHSRNLRDRALSENWSVEEVHGAIDALQAQLEAQDAPSEDLDATSRLRIELTSPRSRR